MRETRTIELRDTNFIYQRNLAGNPEKNGKFRSMQRNVNIIIPDLELAVAMEQMGFKISYTQPPEGEEEGFIPKASIKCIANYESKQPPLIYLVYDGQPPVLLDANSAQEADFVYVTNVNAVISPWPNQNGGLSAYLQVMYIECEVIDPYRNLYTR